MKKRLAARKVGRDGKVVGVDCTPHMIERAKQAVTEAGLTNAVELLVPIWSELTFKTALPMW